MQRQCIRSLKKCLSLYYACTKLRHYLLTSACIVVCQTDVIKHMLQKPILSGRIGKWAYALVEYDLAYESLKSMRGQIVADFIVEHRIKDEQDLKVSYITCTPWKLYFDGSVRDDGRGVGICNIFISPSGAIFVFTTDWKNDVLIIKSNMRHFYLAWNFCNPWAWSMLKPLGIRFWWHSKYQRYANATMVL